MSIPLVQEATKDAINTSIIAIKRNIERINMLLGLSNSEEIDTSEFVKKSDIVDEVALNNMQSVSSNAVAVALSYTSDEHFTGRYWINGKKIYTKTIQISITRGNNSFNHNIADIDYITDFRAISKSNNSGEFRTIPFLYYGALDAWSVGIYVTKTAYQIECGTAFASAHSVGYLTLEYTKTTD